jgi:hypothetical protein
VRKGDRAETYDQHICLGGHPRNCFTRCLPGGRGNLAELEERPDQAPSLDRTGSRRVRDERLDRDRNFLDFNAVTSRERCKLLGGDKGRGVTFVHEALPQRDIRLDVPTAPYPDKRNPNWHQYPL